MGRLLVGLGASWSVWVFYGVRIASGPVIIWNLLGLLPAAVLLAVFLRFERLRCTVAILVLYVLAAFFMVVDLRWGLLAMAVLDVYFYMPSVLRVFRARDVSGVSASANLAHVLLSTSWLAYLLMTGSPLAGVGWAVSVVTYSVIAFRVLSLRRRSRHCVLVA